MSDWGDREALPSVRAFIDRIVADLRDGKSALVLLPPTACADLIAGWIEERASQRRGVVAVRIATAAPKRPHTLLASFISSATPDLTLADLLADPECPDVLLIRGLEDLDPPARCAWVSLGQRYAESIRVLTPRPPRVAALCLLLPVTGLDLPLPSGDAALAVHCWWGLPSALELRLLCRSLGTHGDINDAWRESLVSGLAPGDLTLAERLWEESPCSIEQTRELLCAYAAEHRLPSSPPPGRLSLATGLPGPTPQLRPQPPANVQKDWAAGHLVGSPDFGIEYHPALLVGQETRMALEHRVWRGQQHSLQPGLDRVRLELCLYLRDTFRDGWYYPPGCTPEDARERAQLHAEPLTAQFGLLLRLAGYWQSQHGGQLLGNWKPKLEKLKAARDSLAHYRPLDFPLFRDAYACLTEMPRV